MFAKLQEYWEKVWNWIKALWEKHDEQLEVMVSGLLPLIARMAMRSDLTGEEKRKIVVDAVLDAVEGTADDIAVSMINEAVEVAANRYNIQLGTLTVERMDAAANAVIQAARDFSDGKLNLDGDEAEKVDAVLPRTLSNEDLG